MSEPTVEELEEQISLNRQRLGQVQEQIRTVLHEDIGRFVPRETKRVFVASPGVAQGLTKDRISALKTGADALATRIADQVRDALADDALWLEGEVVTPDDQRSLVSADAVWSVVRAVDAELAALLGEFGLSGANPYKAPMYFVGGLYFPSLAEHYWQFRGELARLQSLQGEIAADTERRNLEELWNSA